jgi:hypothetical protein
MVRGMGAALGVCCDSPRSADHPSPTGRVVIVCRGGGIGLAVRRWWARVNHHPEPTRKHPPELDTFVPSLARAPAPSSRRPMTTCDWHLGALLSSDDYGSSVGVFCGLSAGGSGGWRPVRPTGPASRWPWSAAPEWRTGQIRAVELAAESHNDILRVGDKAPGVCQLSRSYLALPSFGYRRSRRRNTAQAAATRTALTASGSRTAARAAPSASRLRSRYQCQGLS